MGISWESLAEIDTLHLRAYGRVDPALRDTLDPALERLMALVDALAEIALAGGGAPAEDSPDGTHGASTR